MRKLLLALIFIFALCYSLLATEITVSSKALPNWRGGASGKLRVVLNQQIITSDSKILMAGDINRGTWYKELTLSVAGTTATIPSFVIDSTLDSNTPTATYSAYLFDAKGGRQTYLADFRLPASLGGTISWTQIITYNNGTARPPIPGYYTSDQVNLLIGDFATSDEVADLVNAATSGVTTSQSANRIYAGPTSGGAQTPAFRALVAGDIPALDAAKITTGTFIASQIPSLDTSKITTGTFNASIIGSGTLATARLGSGTANSSTFLQGDSTWAEAVKPTDVRLERDLNKDYSNNLTTAVSSIGSTETFLNCTQPVTVSVSVSLPKNIKFNPGRECLVTVAASQTLTIGAFVDPGNIKVFTSTASGARVAFARGAVERENVAWRAGTTANTDITDALSESLADTSANQGGVIYIPNVQYQTTGNLVVTDATTVEGDQNYVLPGYGGTSIKLTGSGNSVFKVGEGEYGIRFRNLLLDGTGTTGKAGILLEGSYPNSSGDLAIENVTIAYFDKGLYYHSLSGSWQFAQVKISQTVFQGNTVGIWANSLNSEFALESVNFAIPDGASARAIYTNGIGIINIKSSEFAGVNLSSASSGNAVMEIDGAHVQINFFGCQDENINYFLINDASDITGIVNLYGNLIQSLVQINASMVLNSMGNNFLPDAIRVTMPASPLINSQFDNIRTDVGTAEAPGVIPASPLRLVKSNDPITQYEFNPIFNYAGGDASKGGLRVRNYARFILPSYLEGTPSMPLVGIGHATTTSETKTLLRLGRLDPSTQEFDYYYDFKRQNSGNNAGELLVDGNQTGFISTKFNGSVYAEGAIRNQTVALTDGAFIQINPSAGNYFYVTLGGNRAFEVAAMTAFQKTRADGQLITLEITQDGTGSRTCTLSTGAGNFSFGTDIPSVTCTTTAGKTDILKAQYSARLDRWMVEDFKKGF
jgi:hypothetical protein